MCVWVNLRYLMFALLQNTLYGSCFQAKWLFKMSILFTLVHMVYCRKMNIFLFALNAVFLWSMITETTVITSKHSEKIYSFLSAHTYAMNNLTCLLYGNWEKNVKSSIFSNFYSFTRSTRAYTSRHNHFIEKYCVRFHFRFRFPVLRSYFFSSFQ